MNRWFTKLAVALLPLFGIPLAQANAGCCRSCGPESINPYSASCACDWCGGFTFGADFLYWQPCIDDLDYAIQFDSAVAPLAGTENGFYKNVHTHWEPGVRGYAVFDNLCGVDLIGTYTWIKVKERSGIEGALPDTLFSTQFNPSVVDALSFSSLASKYRLNYQTFDVLLASICCYKYHVFKPFFGVTGIFLDQKIDTSGTETGGGLDDLKWHSNYWGVGLKFGSEYRICFADGYGIFASGSGAIVAGAGETTRRERSGIGDIGEAVANFKSDDWCRLLNGYHFSGGFFYKDNWCNFDFSLRLGYEFVKWTNAIGLRRYSSDSIPQIGVSPSSTVTTLGFQGAFAGFNLNF